MSTQNHKVSEKTNKGSLLVEALLSVVILSVCITVISQSMVAGLRTAQVNARYIEALILAENKLAEVLQMGVYDGGAREEGYLDESNEEYQYVLETSLFEEQENSQLTQVNLKVSWQTGRRNNRLTLETMMPQEKNE